MLGSPARAALVLGLCLALAPRVHGGAPESATARADADTLTFPRFGTLHLYRPAGEPKHVVLFASGDGGWDRGVVDMARALAALDTLVVGVDTAHYLAGAPSKSECVYAAADFEAQSQFVQQELRLPSYSPPVLVGYSSGATLVYALLAEAPRGTFAGAISLGFCPDLPPGPTLCRGEALASEPPASPKKGQRLLPVPSLETPWIALQGQQDQVCAWRDTQAFVGRVGRAEIVLLRAVGHGFSAPKNWMPQLGSAYERLIGSDRPAALPAADVDGLPLVEVQSDGGGDTLAVVASGDGGWAGLDRQLSGVLAGAGMPVVGLNSLQYLWKRKEPEEAGRALARILEHYFAAWKKERAVLVGYSTGASILPFMASRLSPELRSRIKLIVLLSPSATVDFEFHVGDWLHEAARKTALTVAPEVAKLPPLKVVCYYGRQEDDSLCPLLPAESATSIELPGGHHFGGDYAGIGQRILDQVR